MVDAAAAARIRGVVLSHARTLGFGTAPAWLRDAWLGATPQGSASLIPGFLAEPDALPPCAAPR